MDVTTIDTALTSVSGARAQLGAMQNRLEHTIANLQVYQENLPASESRIRDVDVAQEMVNYTKLQILSQSGTSMLAQANQSAQGVLSLLQRLVRLGPPHEGADSDGAGGRRRPRRGPPAIRLGQASLDRGLAHFPKRSSQALQIR